MTTIPTTFKGGCACGAVRYESTAAPVMMLNCHCRDCQLTSGAPSSSLICVLTSEFKISKGKLNYYDTASEAGGKIHRGFCPTCGSPVLGNPDVAPHIVAIRATSVDDASWFAPTVDVWTSDAQPWDHMDPKIGKAEKYPK